MSLKFGLEYIRTLALYQADKFIAEVTREFNVYEDQIIKLASNKNSLGMSDLAKKAIQNAVININHYPDTNGFTLKNTIRAKYGIQLDWTTLGKGSNEIYELIAHTFLRPKQSVVYAQYSFLACELITQFVRTHLIKVIAKKFGHNLSTITKVIFENTRLIYIANLNNFPSTFLVSSELEIVFKTIAPHVMIVLDEAHNEYLSINLQHNSIKWIHTYSNLIILRTMSKIYGLANLRICFAIAQPNITSLLNRIRQLFNGNLLVQISVIAALNDVSFLQKNIEINALGYQQLTRVFDMMSLEYIPSVANFILLKVDDNNAGTRVNLALLQQGIISVCLLNNYILLQ